MMSGKNDHERTVGSEIISGLEGLRDALRDGERLHKRYTMRTVELELDPREFTAEQVKELRETFRASQAVFAKLIGVSPSTLQSWEQGHHSPPPWGRRLLELMKKNPKPWEEMLEESAKSKDAMTNNR